MSIADRSLGKARGASINTSSIDFDTEEIDSLRTLRRSNSSTGSRRRGQADPAPLPLPLVGWGLANRKSNPAAGNGGSGGRGGEVAGVEPGTAEVPGLEPGTAEAPVSGDELDWI